MQSLQAPSGNEKRSEAASTSSQIAERSIDPTLELRAVTAIAVSCASSWEGVLTAGELMAAETVNPYIAAGIAFGAGLGMTGCIVMGVSKAFMPANSEAYKTIDDISGVFSNAPGFILGTAGSMAFGEQGLRAGAQLGSVLQDVSDLRESGGELSKGTFGFNRKTFKFFMDEQELEEDTEKLSETLRGSDLFGGPSYHWNSVSDSLESYDGSLQPNGSIDGGLYTQPGYDETPYIPPPSIVAPSGDPPSSVGGGFGGGEEDCGDED